MAAALALIDENGYWALTIEAVAVRADAGKTMAALMAEAQSDADLARRLREQWIAARRATLRSILERGQARGEP